MYGEQAATVSAATVNASDTCALLQPNSAVSGFKKMPNVKTRSDPKLTKPPQHAAARIRAGWRGLNRGEWRGLRTAEARNASEYQLQCELKQAWRPRLKDLSKSGGLQIILGQAEVGVIQSIEALCPKLHARRFADLKIFE